MSAADARLLWFLVWPILVTGALTIGIACALEAWGRRHDRRRAGALFWHPSE